MFDKVGQAAESLATHVSRRGFMGSLGRGALAVAGALAGVLALSSDARAGRPLFVCCSTFKCAPPEGRCLPLSLSCSGCVWDCGNGKIMTTGCA